MSKTYAKESVEGKRKEVEELTKDMEKKYSFFNQLYCHLIAKGKKR